MSPVIPTDALNQLFQDLHDSPWTTFLFSLVGLGALTMAILQAVKQGFPIRRWFQQYQMVQWLKLHASLAKENLGLEPCRSRAEEQIILLSTDGDAGAFYDLEIEKLCGQWNAAIQIAIDSPNTYQDFFLCVAARALKDDVKTVMRHSCDAPLPPPAQGESVPDDRQRQLEQRQKYTIERTRVVHQIQRAVDSFQIKTSFRWKWMFQTASFALSFILAYLAMQIPTPSKPVDAATFIWAGLAGFLAPVARNLLAAIENLNP